MAATDRKFLQFTVGNQNYAVDILAVKTVLMTPKTTPVPDAPDYVCGVFNLRGSVLMIIDLRKKLLMKSPEKEEQSGTIVFDLGEKMLGAKVDNIHQVFNVSDEDIKPPPVNSQNIQGVIRHENKLIMWLDPKQLMTKKFAA